jgi:energy-converting hydrogenase Eha subunit F
VAVELGTTIATLQAITIREWVEPASLVELNQVYTTPVDQQMKAHTELAELDQTGITTEPTTMIAALMVKPE